MNKLLFILFIPAMSYGGIIPVETFDQGKLEQLLRRIPGALIKTEEGSGFIRRYTKFPQFSDAPFVISCQADFFGTAQIPSSKSCELEVESGEESGSEKGDEIVVTLTDEASVKDLSSAIPYGQEIKKFISNETVYGKGLNGKYKNLFRFAFICGPQTCEASFSTKKSP